jgi:hypothetical protein
VSISKQKKLQWIFATIGTAFLFRYFYYTDKNFLSISNQSIFSYVFALPGLLWIVFFTNKWFYKKIISVKLQTIITYNIFQKMFTIYQFLIMIMIIIANIKWIK